MNGSKIKNLRRRQRNLQLIPQGLRELFIKKKISRARRPAFKQACKCQRGSSLEQHGLKLYRDTKQRVAIHFAKAQHLF